MIIYKDIISNDELFTDVYPITETAIFYEVQGKHITIVNGDIDGSLIGANASAEEQDEGTDKSSVSGINVVLHNKLVETSYDKKSYIPYIKEYLKKIREKLEIDNPERVDKFMADASAEVKKLIPELKNLQFFTGESMNPEGMVAILDYREDQVTPYLRFFKDGLLEEKC
ncbi:translationally-controlled tumor protein homolog [Dunckerocampus dactyliophorus]|uniref:translationally-controlled tumor protein homolog n=1 Tax=Dunckerocampus dactyliophorus TaxID=161453 RepID=UPI00240501F2|nr:translationally-controlled tumor protein homolog [Dunckerocampus dactyliophorus]